MSRKIRNSHEGLRTYKTQSERQERVSRTRKGSKGPGWEYWGTGKKHQEPAPDYDSPDYDDSYAYNEELRIAIDCALYGPCEVCKANKEKEEQDVRDSTGNIDGQGSSEPSDPRNEEESGQATSSSK